MKIESHRKGSYCHSNPRKSRLNRQILELLTPYGGKGQRARYAMLQEYVLGCGSINDALERSPEERPNTWRTLQKMVDKGWLVKVTVKDTRYAGNGYYTTRDQESTAYVINDPELLEEVREWLTIRHTDAYINEKVRVFIEHFRG